MAAMDEPSVMFSDLFKWIPRWRDKVVIELWSMGTFMRLDWSEKHQAVVAAKAKEDNEKTWKAMQEETRKNLDQERLEKGAASRQHAARIAEASQERAAKAEEQRKKQLDQTIEVRFNEESKQAYVPLPPHPLLLARLSFSRSLLLSSSDSSVASDACVCPSHHITARRGSAPSDHGRAAGIMRARRRRTPRTRRRRNGLSVSSAASASTVRRSASRRRSVPLKRWRGRGREPP